MEDTNISMFCSLCATRLKRQVMGSNVFYYCRKCGRISSDFCLSEENRVLSVQKQPVRKVPSAMGMEFPEEGQKAGVEN
ncbi:hypothetical protein FTO70_01940 [Methanosarcina sp. KYL-1]|uniref:hypothetical protein n=1 Tax=Methanosarcina sp. KYL-1 TaxID=2602068 RepID=UPI00210103C1|nr:hypothetical protein [Methanosarcina sp. KYL-1]MCQ1534475.1 hypothetical protein [Methanosarcina sp. KYL-1]